MNNKAKFAPERFSWKRVLLLVAAVQVVLGATLFIYWRVFREEFFPYPVNADGTVTVEDTGPLLVGYGMRIDAPWVFTGVGTDTLRLNGLPFEPMRSADFTENLPASQRDRVRTIKLLLEEAEVAYQEADGKTEGMRRFAASLERYAGGLVNTVLLDEGSEMLTCDFVDDLPPVTVNFVHGPHWVEPEGLRRHRQYDAMKTFIEWMAPRQDGVFGFGQYHVLVSDLPAIRAEHERVLDALDSLDTHSRRIPAPEDVERVLDDPALFGRYSGLIRDHLTLRAASGH